MRFEDFEERMKKAVERNLPEEWGGSEVSIRHVDKIGGSYEALTITHPIWNVGPSINLTEMYKQLNGIVPPDWMISDYVRDIAAEAKNIQSRVKDMPDTYEEVKDSLYVKLVNYEANEEHLRTVPHRKVMDYALTVKNGLKWTGNGAPEASYTVNNALMHSWGITQDQLIDDALANTEKILPLDFRPLSAVLGDMTGEYGPDEREPSNPLYVVSNNVKVDGAAALLYPGTLDKVSDRIGSFYILPSSVHELLLMPEKWMNPDAGAGDLDKMIRTVNATEVEPEDILGNRSFHYDAKTKSLEPGSEYEARKMAKEMTPVIDAPEKRMNL